MATFSINELTREMAARPVAYHEFLKVPAMSTGIYRLEPGSTDPQQPHEQDEIYYVVSGRGEFVDTDGRRKIGEGDVIYVGALEEHRFVDITETLVLLVVFAPAESG